MKRNLHACAIIGVGIITLLPAMSGGQDFRIETAVYSADDEAPVAETSTLFHAGVVYDFLNEPPQVAVFRPASGNGPGRFVLLDLDHQVRTELTTDRIGSLLDKLKMWSKTQPDTLQQFIAVPKFAEQFDEATGTLTLASDTMTYRVETEHGGDASSMAAYREFCDWYARLNAVTQQAMLPYPRLKLNAALDVRGRVPTQVRLTMPEKELDLRAEHVFTWRISRTDRQRIDNVGRQLREFELVDNKVFRK